MLRAKDEVYIIKIDPRSLLEVADVPLHRYGKNLRLYFKEFCRLKGVQNEHGSSHESCEDRFSRLQPFFQWLDHSTPLPELEVCPRTVLQDDRVEYLNTSEERDIYKYIVDENGVWRHCITNEPLNTGPKGWIFVMKYDAIFACEKRTNTFPRFHHSSFFSGEGVNAAGMILAENGRITKLYPHSGHYRPEDKHLYWLLSFLKSKDTILSEVQVDAQRLFKVARTMDKDTGAKTKKVEQAYMKNGQYVHDFLQAKQRMVNSGVFSDIRTQFYTLKESPMISICNTPVDHQHHMSPKNMKGTSHIMRSRVEEEEAVRFEQECMIEHDASPPNTITLPTTTHSEHIVKSDSTEDEGIESVFQSASHLANSAQKRAELLGKLLYEEPEEVNAQTPPLPYNTSNDNLSNPTNIKPVKQIGKIKIRTNKSRKNPLAVSNNATQLSRGASFDFDMFALLAESPSEAIFAMKHQKNSKSATPIERRSRSGSKDNDEKGMKNSQSFAAIAENVIFNSGGILSTHKIQSPLVSPKTKLHKSVSPSAPRQSQALPDLRICVTKRSHLIPELGSANDDTEVIGYQLEDDLADSVNDGLRNSSIFECSPIRSPLKEAWKVDCVDSAKKTIKETERLESEPEEESQEILESQRLSTTAELIDPTELRVCSSYLEMQSLSSRSPSRDSHIDDKKSNNTTAELALTAEDEYIFIEKPPPAKRSPHNNSNNSRSNSNSNLCCMVKSNSNSSLQAI